MVFPPRIRSSVACLRCRKSKIKCDNSGHLDVPCENCIKSDQTCTWPGSIPLPSKRQRRSSPENQSLLREPDRKRLKNHADIALLGDSQRAQDTLLIQSIERRWWDETFDTYQRHFATELPFLHVPTLKVKIFDLVIGTEGETPGFYLVLNGILALTARCNPALSTYLEQLSRRHAVDLGPGSRYSIGLQTSTVSDFFAKTLDRDLGSIVTATSVGSVERVQALLILGFYEWISPHHESFRAWMLVGAAGRMAQALNLDHEEQIVVGDKSMQPPGEETTIDREVKRRTMFSCYMIDSLISCGKDRVPIIRSEDIHIQLPCAKEDFDLGRLVRTATLADEHLGEQGNSNVLSRFVQLVDLWSLVSQYSNAGGRFTERGSPPWSHESRFFNLRQKLNRFDQILQIPRTGLSFNGANYFRHDSTSGTYVLLHMLMSLLRIMLHREYIPFIAIKCRKPCGPLDGPTYSANIVPPGFWEDSAKELFTATKTVAKLIELCGERLPHSPLVAFVIYTASFNGIYARYFPRMDHEKVLIREEDKATTHAGSAPNSSFIGVTKVFFDALTELAKFSGVASAFVSRFLEVEQYFFSMVQDYNRNTKCRSTNTLCGSRSIPSIRNGDDTGGLEEWVEQSDRMHSNSSIVKHKGCARSANQSLTTARDVSIPTSDFYSRTADESWETPQRHEPLGNVETCYRSSHGHDHTFPRLADGASNSTVSVHTTHVDSSDCMLFDKDLDMSWPALEDMFMGNGDVGSVYSLSRELATGASP